MNYIVTKPIKSKGMAALLVFVFGGIGLFYASIAGGVIMGLISPLLVILLLLWAAAIQSKAIITAIIVFCCIYHIICLLWALNSVQNYNNKIIAESKNLNKTNYLSNHERNINTIKKDSTLLIWVLFILVIGSLIYLLYYQGIIFKNSNTKIKNKDTTLNLQPNKVEKKEYQFNKIKNEEKKNKEKLENIDINALKFSNTIAWKVSKYYEGTDLNGEPMKSETQSKYFVFYKKKIYLIINGNLAKTWTEKVEYFENEIQVIETKEGDVFSIFGDIDITFKDGKFIHYECEQVPIKEAIFGSGSV